MKLLIASHTYTEKVNRKKLLFLTPKFSLQVIVPPAWTDTLAKIELGKEEAKETNVRSCPIFLNGHINGYFYQPVALWRLIKEFQPDVVYVEEEPTSVALLQFAFLKHWFKYTLGFFSWENIYKTVRHPLILAYNLSHSDFAVAGNKEAAAVIKKRKFNKPIEVIPQLGVDLDMFYYDAEKRQNVRQSLDLQDSFVIGYAGRLVFEKGVHLLLQATSKLRKPFKLLILGRGPYRQQLVSLAKELGIYDRTVWVEGVPHRKVPLYLNAMDCLVLPSLTTNFWKEQYGQVLVQAMACEVPVIGSNSGAIPEVIQDNGLIFTEGDVEDLAEKIALIMTKRQLAFELKKKALTYVKAEHASNVLAFKLAAFLERVV